MDKLDVKNQELFCCYLPCKNYMVKGGSIISLKGIKNGLPEYECSVCRHSFTLPQVIKLENNITGIKGTIVYNSLFVLGIVFFSKLPIVYKLFLLVLPITFIVLSGKKLYGVYQVIKAYRNERGGFLTRSQEVSLAKKYLHERELIRTKIT